MSARASSSRVAATSQTPPSQSAETEEEPRPKIPQRKILKARRTIKRQADDSPKNAPVEPQLPASPLPPNIVKQNDQQGSLACPLEPDLADDRASDGSNIVLSSALLDVMLEQIYLKSGLISMSVEETPQSSGSEPLHAAEAVADEAKTPTDLSATSPRSRVMPVQSIRFPNFTVTCRGDDDVRKLQAYQKWMAMEKELSDREKDTTTDDDKAPDGDQNRAFSYKSCDPETRRKMLKAYLATFKYAVSQWTSADEDDSLVPPQLRKNGIVNDKIAYLKDVSRTNAASPVEKSISQHWTYMFENKLFGDMSDLPSADTRNRRRGVSLKNKLPLCDILQQTRRTTPFIEAHRRTIGLMTSQYDCRPLLFVQDLLESTSYFEVATGAEKRSLELLSIPLGLSVALWQWGVRFLGSDALALKRCIRLHECTVHYYTSDTPTRQKEAQLWKCFVIANWEKVALIDATMLVSQVDVPVPSFCRYLDGKLIEVDSSILDIRKTPNLNRIMGDPLVQQGITCLRDGHATWEEFVQDYPTCFIAFDPDLLFYGNEMYPVLCNINIAEDMPCAYFDPVETPPLPAFCEFDSARILQFENMKLINDDYLGIYRKRHKPTSGRMSKFRQSFRLSRVRRNGHGVPPAKVILEHSSHSKSCVEVRVGLYTFTKGIKVALGHGTYGSVYPGKHRQNGSRVAIKVVESKADEETKKQAFAELQALKKWTGRQAKRNLLLMVDSYYLDGIMYIVTERCIPGDLQRYMENNDLAFFHEENVIHIAKQLAAAMVELDQLGIMHRDIKPSNIMLHDARRTEQSVNPMRALLELTVKLADFGFSKILAKTARGTARTHAGSKAYMAPEVVLKKKYDARVDMFSIGVVLYECMEGELPFPDCLDETGDKLRGLYSSENTDSKISFSQGRRAALCNLVKSLMRYDPKQRMTAYELADHELLQVHDQSYRNGYIKTQPLRKLVEPSFGRPVKLGQPYSQYKGCLLNNLVPSPPMQTLLKQTRLSDSHCTMEWFVHKSAEDRFRALVQDESRVQALKFDLLIEGRARMDHGYGAYITDRSLRGKTCVTLVFRLSYKTELLDGTNRDAYMNYFTSMYALGNHDDNVLTTHFTSGIGHGVIVILALYLDREAREETAQSAAVYEAIRKKFSQSVMSTGDVRLYENNRKYVSCRMFSNIYLEEPEHSEGIEANVDAWLAVLNKMATDPAFTANVMTNTRMKDTTASQIWFEIVPVKDVVKQSPAVTSIRQTVCVVPERCWNIIERALYHYECDDEINMQYPTVWMTNAFFRHVPKSISRAAVDTIVKINGDIRDGRHKAANVVCKIRMGRGDWTTALDLWNTALDVEGNLHFRSIPPKEYDPREKLRHCMNVLEAMRDCGVEFIKHADLTNNRWRRFHSFVAVFDWNLVEKTPNTARDVLECISKLAELGHNSAFLDVTDELSQRPFATPPCILAFSDGFKKSKAKCVNIEHVLSMSRKPFLSCRSMEDTVEISLRTDIRKMMIERDRLLVRTEVLNAGINVIEPVDTKELRFERYPVYVAFYDSFLAEEYSEATEAVLENIKRIKSEGMEAAFMDTAKKYRFDYGSPRIVEYRKRMFLRHYVHNRDVFEINKRLVKPKLELILCRTPTSS